MGRIFFHFIILALGPLMIYFDGAQLKTDYLVRSDDIIETYIPTTDRECRSTFMIFHQCGFTYYWEGEEKSMDYMFFAFGAPDTVRLQIGSQSGELTSTVGQEYFWNRAITMLFGLLLSGFMLLSMFSAIGNLRSRPEEDLPDYARNHPGYPQHEPDSYNPVQSGFGRRGTDGFGKRRV